MPIAIPLLVLLAFIFAYGGYVAYEQTFGALFRAAAKVFRSSLAIGPISIGIPLGGKIGAEIDKAGHWVRAAIASRMQLHELRVGTFLHELATNLDNTVATIANAFAATAAVLHQITTVTVPHLIGVHTRGLSHRVAAGSATADARWRAEQRARSAGIEAGVRDLHAETLARVRGIDAIQADIRSRVMPRIRTAEHAIAGLRGYAHRVLGRRITRLEELLGLGVIGAAGFALVTRAFPWLRCTNVRKVGRELCRFPTGILDDLLGAGIAILVWSDLCQISRAIEKAAKVFEPELRDLVVVAGAATSCWPPTFSPLDPPVNYVAPPTPAGTFALDRSKG